jgi:DNA mismatch repair ATPase MutS
MVRQGFAPAQKRQKSSVTPRFDIFNTPAGSVGGSTTRTTSTAAGTTGTTGASDTIFIAAIIENRAFEVGIAAIDLRSNHMMLTQVGDNQNYSATMSMLATYDPAELIISSKARGTKLLSTVQTALPGVSVTDIERKYFNDTVRPTIGSWPVQNITRTRRACERTHRADALYSDLFAAMARTGCRFSRTKISACWRM